MTEKTSTKSVLVMGERVHLFYGGLGFAGLVTLLLSGFLIWLQGGVVDLRTGLWGGCMLLAGLAQILLWYLWQRLQPDVKESWNWQYYPIPVTLLVGLGWGSALTFAHPEYLSDLAFLSTLTAGAGAFLTVMLLAALELVMLLFFVACLLPLMLVVYHTGVWPSSLSVLLMLAAFITVGLAAAAFSVLFGIIARLRAGNRNVNSKLHLAREEMIGLHSRLNDQDEKRRDVEHELYLAKEAAETATMVKSEFLATMSHEIRTPLNGIMPLLEILRDTELNKEQKQYVDTALNSSHHLLSIINDILDFSKIEAGKLELESIELKPENLVDSVVVMMAKSAERRGLHLDYKIEAGVPKFVRGDPIRLRQVLTNLVSNAIKFTEKGGIMVEVARRDSFGKEIELVFAVKDTGIGMSKETQARLFKSFTQADASTTRKHGGTGLGLVISKRLVELMGGKIGVHSEKGRGSVFWFVSPMRKSLRDAPPQRSSLKGVHALVVDGPSGELLRIEEFLEQWGVEFQRVEGILDAYTRLISAAKGGEDSAYDLMLANSQALGGRLRTLISDIAENPSLNLLKKVVVGDPGWMVQRGEIDGRVVSPVKQGDLHRVLCRVLDAETQESESQSYEEESIRHKRYQADVEHGQWEGIPEIGKKMPSEESQQQEGPLVGRVLVVEDNAVNMTVARKLLHRMGLEYDCAEDGVDALDAIDKAQYDLVLMDCQMPRMDGYEATRAIRLREATKGLTRLPVIAMTANAMVGDREKCLDAGMDDYLSKPLLPNTLNSMLHNWLPMKEVVEDQKAPPARRTQPQGQSPLTVAATDSAIDSGVIDELSEVMDEDFTLILETFLESAPALIEEIEEGVRMADLKRIALSAHSLKSGSANVGAMALSELAKRIELSARGGLLKNARESAQQLRDEYERAGLVLENICSKVAR